MTFRSQSLHSTGQSISLRYSRCLRSSLKVFRGPLICELLHGPEIMTGGHWNIGLTTEIADVLLCIREISAGPKDRRRPGNKRFLS